MMMLNKMSFKPGLWAFIVPMIAVMISGVTMAGSQEIRETGQYQIQLSDPSDHLNCREEASLKANVVNRYYQGEIVETVYVVNKNGRYWLQTTENCFIRASSQYLQTAKKATMPLDRGSKNVNDDPMMLVLSKHPPFESGKRSISLQPSGVSSVDTPASKVTIILTEEDVADTSVAAVRYRYEVQKNGKGQWSISKALPTLQKCQKGRGQQVYAEALCL